MNRILVSPPPGIRNVLNSGRFLLSEIKDKLNSNPVASPITNTMFYLALILILHGS